MAVKIGSKFDIINELLRMEKTLNEIRGKRFDLPPVSKLSAIKSISFDIKREAKLKELGALSQCPEWRYGYFRSNENNARVNNELLAIVSEIDNIREQLQDYYLKPKFRRYTDDELSIFEVIEGDGQDSLLVNCLKGGVYNV